MAIQIKEFLSSTSASPSIIGKGTCKGVPAFFKIFYDGENPEKKTRATQALSYELEVYKHIHLYPDDIKKYYINLLNYMSGTTIQALIDEKIITNPDDTILTMRMTETGILPLSSISIIITEDTNSKPLFDMNDIPNSFIYKYTDEYLGRIDEFVHDYDYVKRSLNNIFDLVITGIKTLNQTLKIQHNDMHFGNILIKTAQVDYVTERNKTLLSDYKISIFDFDRSYLIGRQNPILDILCEKGKGCNSFSNKDYFVFIQSILEIKIRLSVTRQHNFLCEYMNNLFNALVPEEFRKLLITHRENSRHKTNPFWSAYCFFKVRDNINPGYPCDDPKIQDRYMNWLSEVPDKFNEFVKNDIETEYSYFKKYLKYKNKYLQYKNKFNIL
jgi:hypothetical protein